MKISFEQKEKKDIVVLCGPGMQCGGGRHVQ